MSGQILTHGGGQIVGFHGMSPPPMHQIQIVPQMMAQQQQGVPQQFQKLAAGMREVCMYVYVCMYMYV